MTDVWTRLCERLRRPPDQRIGRGRLSALLRAALPAAALACGLRASTGAP